MVKFLSPSERAQVQAARNIRTGVSLMMTILPKSCGCTNKEAKVGIIAALDQVKNELLQQVK